VSPFDVAFGLMKNLVAGTLSITFIGLIRAASWKRNRIMPGWLLGLLFAGAAFVGLLFPVTYSPGVLRDFRNILIALASYYGGLQSGLVAAGIAGAYRFYLGGGGDYCRKGCKVRMTPVPLNLPVRGMQLISSGGPEI